MFRSSHRRCSVKKDVLRKFAKFTGKLLCQSPFFNKVADLRPIFWLVVGGGGYILAGGGWWWVVVAIFWLVVGGGGWWWVVVSRGGW